MSANRDPIFTKNGTRGSVLVTAANASSQGGGTIATDIFLLYTAGAEGDYVQWVRWIATATTPTATVATTARLFRSTLAAGATTSANTFLIDELTLPTVNAASLTIAVNKFDMAMGYALAPNESLLVSCGTAPAANSAWRAVVGDSGNF